MRRRLFTFASGVSLGLCIVAAALWVRSYWRYDEVSRESNWLVSVTRSTEERQIDSYSLSSSRGKFLFIARHARYRRDFDEVGPWSHGTKFEWNCLKPCDFGDSDAGKILVSVFGLAAGTAWSPDAKGWLFDRRFLVPPWMVVVATLILPGAWLLTRKPVRKGCCAACGYDLRATPDRCPECGMALNATCRAGIPGLSVEP